VTMNENDIRFKIAASRRMLARHDCESLVAGHVSAREEPGADEFWVSPFEYFDETLPNRLIKSNMNLQLVEGDWEPSPAISFHAAIYRARPDVMSVIHTHSHWSMVFSTTRELVGQYNVGSVLFWDEQGLYEDDGTRPPVEGSRLTAALGQGSVIHLKNHGAIIATDSLEKSTILAIMLEKCAQYHIEAKAIGGTEFPEAEVVRGKQAYLKYFIPNMWTANVRRLRRSDPDLFAWMDDYNRALTKAKNKKIS
jgi:L-fuculose-phosphate aldolase